MAESTLVATLLEGKICIGYKPGLMAYPIWQLIVSGDKSSFSVTLTHPTHERFLVVAAIAQLGAALTDDFFRLRCLHDVSTLKEVSTLVKLEILPPDLNTP